MLAAVFSFLVAAAGWHYLFYSRAAHRLEGVEDAAILARRIRLRRLGGGAMLALGICFFAMFRSLDWERSDLAFAILSMLVLVLLLSILVLGLVDLRLTLRLRRRPRL